MPRKQPTLEDLISRIVRLEAENTVLKENIYDLEARLVKSFEMYSASVLDRFTKTDTLLAAVVDKVFPRYFEMLNSIHDVVPPCSVDPRIDQPSSKAKTSN